MFKLSIKLLLTVRQDLELAINCALHVRWKKKIPLKILNEIASNCTARF